MKSRVYISRRCIVSIPVDSGGVGTYPRARSTEPKLSLSGLAFHSRTLASSVERMPVRFMVDAISFKDHLTLILRSIYISYLYNVS
jgi:hypothetical protein